jgi:hypothetical protein
MASISQFSSPIPAPTAAGVDAQKKKLGRQLAVQSNKGE